MGFFGDLFGAPKPVPSVVIKNVLDAQVLRLVFDIFGAIRGSRDRRQTGPVNQAARNQSRPALRRNGSL